MGELGRQKRGRLHGRVKGSRRLHTRPRIHSDVQLQPSDRLHRHRLPDPDHHLLVEVNSGTTYGYNQCDQMDRLLVQYLVIYSHESFPSFQNWLNFLAISDYPPPQNLQKL